MFCYPDTYPQKQMSQELFMLTVSKNLVNGLKSFTRITVLVKECISLEMIV